MIDDRMLFSLLNEVDDMFKPRDAGQLTVSGPCDTWQKLRPVVVQLIPVLNAIGAFFPKVKIAAKALEQLKLLLDALCPSQVEDTGSVEDALDVRLESVLQPGIDSESTNESPCDKWQKLKPVVEEVVAAMAALAVEFPVLARIATTIQRISSLVDTFCGTGRTVEVKGRQAKTGTTIGVWEDDPLEIAVGTNPPVPSTITTVSPTINKGFLKVQIDFGAVEPQPKIYPTNTPEFRYWNTKDALNRGIVFWEPVLPKGTAWTQTSNPLHVNLDGGEDFNAYYQRGTGLVFFHGSVTRLSTKPVVFSADSPHVSCHELGHAILDAVKPELFHVMGAEIAAFHESFGDISSILVALQSDAYRKLVIERTGGTLNNNSRLSQLARQLGWGIRQQFGPTSVDADSLRNACNRFIYRNPSTLPSLGPATTLTSEPHSLSRVFTGAFLDILAGVFSSGNADSSTLQLVTVELSKLLIGGIRVSSVGPGYFSHVAAGMIQVDQTLNNGRYRNALVTSFVRRGILATGAAVSLVNNLVQGSQDIFGVTSGPDNDLQFANDNHGYRETANTPEMPLLPVQTRFGETLFVHVPIESNRFGVASSAISGGWDATLSEESEAEAFLQDLFERGHIDFKDAPELAAFAGRTPESSKTHYVTNIDGKLTVKRHHFLCDCCSG